MRWIGGLKLLHAPLRAWLLVPTHTLTHACMPPTPLTENKSAKVKSYVAQVEKSVKDKVNKALSGKPGTASEFNVGCTLPRLAALG